MLTIKDGKFYLDDEKFNIYSGAVHYFRVHPDYWRDRLTKLKAMGLNTVETYVAWNLHEEREGEFDFSGIRNVRKFIEIAKELGLYVIVRPGPYICAEWDFGGFPAWLLKYPDLKLRCYEEKYMYFVKRYLTKLFEEIGDLEYAKGGNVIAMQIENEYGSYGRDKKYLSELKKIYRDLGITSLLFTSDGERKDSLSGGRVEDELMVANFGSNPKKKFSDLREMQPNKPLTCGEFWCGWFTYYGGNYNAGSSANQVASYLKEFLEMDANFNFYMFHGGTNFGFSAGANCYEYYTPDIASYDYGAPLTEWGDYTEKYHKCREILLKHRGIESTPLPPRPQTIAYDSVKLDKKVGLRKVIGKLTELHESNLPYHMEHFGQNQGYVLYSTTIDGEYNDTTLTLEEVHDVAYVYVNEEFKGRFNRLKVNYYKGGKDNYTLPLKGFKGKIRIDILVEAMGRVNYGDKMYDRKGLGNVLIGNQRIYDWQIRTMPLDDVSALTWEEEITYPAFFKGEFEIDGERKDAFVDMKGFTKGCVFVNGVNLGRYWNEGPQRTFYIPAPLLKEKNEIVVFELEKAYSDEVSFAENPIYGTYLPQNGSTNAWKKIFKCKKK